MQFVNASGKPIDIDAAKAAAASRRKGSRPSAASYHKGWVVSGYPPEQLRQAKQDHEDLTRRNLEANRVTLPWDEDRYMRNHKPTKVQSRPYETLAAAESAVALASKHGWKGVSINEVKKGQL